MYQHSLFINTNMHNKFVNSQWVPWYHQFLNTNSRQFKPWLNLVIDWFIERMRRSLTDNRCEVHLLIYDWRATAVDIGPCKLLWNWSHRTLLLLLWNCTHRAPPPLVLGTVLLLLHDRGLPVPWNWMNASLLLHTSLLKPLLTLSPLSHVQE